MSLIIEGLNGVGKTTLCNKIMTLPHFKKYEYHHLTADEDNSYSFYTKLLKNKKLILDRGALGELVYSSIYGRKPRITLSEVNKLFKNVNCYVLLPTNLDQIIDNLISKGEKDSNECNSDFIKLEYNTFMKFANKLYNISIVPYDYKRMSEYLPIFRG